MKRQRHPRPRSRRAKPGSALRQSAKREVPLFLHCACLVISWCIARRFALVSGTVFIWLDVPNRGIAVKSAWVRVLRTAASDDCNSEHTQHRSVVDLGYMRRRAYGKRNFDFRNRV
jgi:hypothetical protein